MFDPEMFSSLDFDTFEVVQEPEPEPEPQEAPEGSQDAQDRPRRRGVVTYGR